MRLGIKDHDMEQASDILEELEVEDTTIIQPVRLGEKSDDANKSPRLLKVTVSNENVKKAALLNAKRLRKSTNRL